MPILISKPYAPPSSKLDFYMRKILKSRNFTNNGPLVRELTSRLEGYLGVDNLILTGNGTLALQIAIRAFDLKGTVATTPFSFPSTSSALIWQGCKPQYHDIDKETLNIQLKSEDLDSNVSGILATHVFGNPCDLDELDKVAAEKNLTLLYDAAHCFSIKVDGKSVLTFGDASVLSFHATKIFHTVEGGALIISNDELHERAKRLVNFGYDSAGLPCDVGINAKMNEVEAAVGLATLDDIDNILASYQARFEAYDSQIHLEYKRQKIDRTVAYNYSYYPLICPSEAIRESALNSLEEKGIYARRYFFPSLNTIKQFGLGDVCPVSEDIASRIICLPLSYDLPFDVVSEISLQLNRCLE